MDQSVWNSVLGEIELSVSKANYMMWFKNTEMVDNSDGHITIEVPNIFTKQQLEVKYDDIIKDTLTRQGVETRAVNYKIHTTPPRKPKSETILSDRPRSLGLVDHTSSNTLNDKYTFENFIVGSGNELAYTACQAIAANPGTKYNPLFIYGGVGLGKTHLIQAVGNGILKKKPSATIVYISTETFVKEFLDSIRFKKQFSNHYRTADVLIVDDIQFIAGKEKTQEEFFHTFNTLHQADKQIILTSDKPPKAIPTLEERLRSRFEWGMAIDIQPPDLETRQAIIQTKAHQHGFELDEAVVDELAKGIQTNIRELEGSLNQLLAFCELRGIQPDVATAQALLQGKQQRPKHVTPKVVIEKTAQHFDLTMQDITGPKRDKSIVLPRQLAMYLLRSELHMSFPKIANELGRKDHTTAIHSVEKITNLSTHDYVVRQYIQELREKIYG